MPMSVQIGLALALATALGSIVGFLLKHRGALSAPAVEWRHPLASTIALFRSPLYVFGCVVATSSWGTHVGALALAPISLVQTTIAGGLVLLTVMADRAFGLRVTRREWVGVALTATGLAVLAATLGTTANSARSHWTAPPLVLEVGLATAAGAILVFLASRRGTREGLMLGVSAGLLWGASDLSIKAASHAAGAFLPLAVVVLVLSLVGLLVSARSLQLGPAVPVITATSATANIVTIAAGPLVFGEPLPGDPVGLAVRLGALALVVTAAALTSPRAVAVAS